MHRLVIGTLAGIGIAGMATSPAAYATQSSGETTVSRPPPQDPETIVLAGPMGGGMGMASGGNTGGMGMGGGGLNTGGGMMTGMGGMGPMGGPMGMGMGMGGAGTAPGGGPAGGAKPGAGGMGATGAGGGAAGGAGGAGGMAGTGAGGGAGGAGGVGGMGGAGAGGLGGGGGVGGMGGAGGPGGGGGVGGMGGAGGPGGGGGFGGMGGMGGVVVISGRPVTLVTGPRFVNWGGRTRRIVAISALPVAVGTIAIAGRPYYASGYPAVAATPNTCTGVTAEGCELRLQDVPMDGGGNASVCISYCPWQDGQQAPGGAPPPQQ
jgi:hypothetical protein